MTDKNLLNIAQYASESASLFSNKGTKARELLSVAVFLDLARVNFDTLQLRLSSPEPPDVIFQASQEHQGKYLSIRIHPAAMRSKGKYVSDL